MGTSVAADPTIRQMSWKYPECVRNSDVIGWLTASGRKKPPSSAQSVRHAGMEPLMRSSWTAVATGTHATSAATSRRRRRRVSAASAVDTRGDAPATPGAKGMATIWSDE